MHTAKRLAADHILFLLLLLPACSAERTVWNGVYTAEQAERGRNVYADHCALCHAPNLTGFNQRIKGPRFMEEWREDNLSSLFIQIKRDMPAENPSSLTDAEYLDVLAYLLQENGFPKGSSELQFELLEEIQIVDKDGHKPIPEGAVIQTFGCLTRESAENWILTGAAFFTRGRNRKELDAGQLKRLDEQPPGRLTVGLDMRFFRLFEGKNVDLATHDGRKLVIKGYLQSAKNIPQVVLLSIQPIGSTCAPSQIGK